MTTSRALLRALAPATDGIALTVDRLNEHLVPDLEDNKFMSLFAASIDSATGAVDWCNAGHCPPLHFRAETGEIRELRGTGLVLGVMAGLGYEAGEPFVLAPGDSLLAFTDGITEARRADGEMFGDERLQALFAANAGENAPTILAAVRAGVLEWTGDAANDDDLTLLAVRRLSGGSG
jgi:sigma-B regulation protein RsbU (phosphoserine phosphatase)